MSEFILPHDPYNLIITGVGGQGNVMSSRVIGNMLSLQGFHVTIGETFGASQRGGSVMSHVRISKNQALSPQIPQGAAHMIVSLEPIEALRLLGDYGNPGVKVICNTRPTYPVGVISGKLDYPSQKEIEGWVGEASASCWFFDATEIAVGIGHPILGNIVMAGALAGTGDLPLSREIFRTLIAEKFGDSKAAQNMAAFEAGLEMVS